MLLASTATEALRRLLEMTPDPPSNLDASDLIEIGSNMYQSRETELAILKLVLGDSPSLLEGNLEARALRDAIALQDRRWQSALDQARGKLFERRAAAQRARQSQRAYLQSAS